jgi:hypothetical protein
MPVYVPQTNQTPRSGGKTRSLGAVLGLVDQPSKRPVLFGRFTVPKLGFDARMQWLAKVQRLVAQCAEARERMPKTIMSVANVMAHIGDECRLSREGIAERAGIRSLRTVQACIDWLEEHGVLTWANTAKRDEKSRRIVRWRNVYTLILDFMGLRALVTRARRALWRERPKEVSEGKICPGVTQEISSEERFNARRTLAEINRKRQAFFVELWNARHAT